jgi:hypothetical protein
MRTPVAGLVVAGVRPAPSGGAVARMYAFVEELASAPYKGRRVVQPVAAPLWAGSPGT